MHLYLLTPNYTTAFCAILLQNNITTGERERERDRERQREREKAKKVKSELCHFVDGSDF